MTPLYVQAPWGATGCVRTCQIVQVRDYAFSPGHRGPFESSDELSPNLFSETPEKSFRADTFPPGANGD